MIIKTVKIAYTRLSKKIVKMIEESFGRYDDLGLIMTPIRAKDAQSGFDFIVTRANPSKMPKGSNILWIKDIEKKSGICPHSFIFDMWMEDEYIRQRIASFVSAIHDKYLLEFTKSLLITTMNTSEDLIWHKSTDGIHLLVNNTFCNAVGKKLNNIVGKDHYDVWSVPRPDNMEDEYVCVTSEDVVKEKKCYCLFDEDVKIHNSIHKFATGKSPVFNLDGDLVATVGVGKDVTTETIHKKALEKLAMTDALTGTYNRNFITGQVVPNMKIYGIAFFDINYFKEVNDLLGHESGDKLLIQVASIIQRYMCSDIIARWGGDEFIVIRTSPVEYQEFYEEVVDLIYRMNLIISGYDGGIGSSMSVGIAISDEKDGKSFDRLIEEADKSMYKMKQDIHEMDGKICR